MALANSLGVRQAPPHSAPGATPLGAQPQWQTSPSLVPYPEALAAMQARIAAMRAGTAPELVWLLEHPPLYTAGTSANVAAELREAATAQPLPVYETGRGGKLTYHGPGQRVAYVLLDLRARDGDVRAHVWRLEEWAIMALGSLGVVAARREGRIGLWVETPRGEEKIGAIGVRVTQGVTWHGLALNVNPNLGHFSGIVPCGLPQFGVTSLAALGSHADMAALDAALKNCWPTVFG